MFLEIKIKITGNFVELLLCDAEDGRIIAGTKWKDKKDLSGQLFSKINALLEKQDAFIKDVIKVGFECDSPYFGNYSETKEIKMENVDSTGKCGFTAWQTGEIVSKVMNFALKK